MKDIAVLFFGLIGCGNLTAQHDSIVVLDEVHLVNSRLNELSAGTKLHQMDSVVKAQFSTGNLADLLSNESGMFIKSYGQGSLATSSFRGGSASQTAILWNGINMNSSMNGILDLSLVPNLFFDDISVQYGGGSSLWGSGGFGGAIHLNSSLRLVDTVNVHLSASMGSFGLNTQQTVLKIGTKKRAFSLGFSRNEADNDFPFYHSISGQLDTDNAILFQRNAHFSSTGLTLGYKVKLSDNSALELNSWYQLTDRELPPTISQIQNQSQDQSYNLPEQKSYQDDRAVRTTAAWKYFKGRNKWRIQGAFFREEIQYDDSVAAIFADNVANQFVAQVEYARKFSKMVELNVGALNTLVSSKTSNYLQRITENRAAVFTALKIQSKHKKWKAILSAREALVQNLFVTPTIALQSSYAVKKWMKLKMKASTVYRVPTLNDKYWNPGGNVDLQPESGYSFELGSEFVFKVKKDVRFQSEWTVFNKEISNWIAWVPNGSFWSPENFKHVWSRGVETLSEIKYRKKEWTLSLKVMTNYVLSTNERTASNNDKSLHKQLIYVPRYTGFTKLTLAYKAIMCAYRHNYTGYTFTSSDNASYIPPYHLGAFYFSWNTKVRKAPINIFLSINNVWNESYQRVVNRAMPLTNYSFGVKVHMGRSKKGIKKTN